MLKKLAALAGAGAILLGLAVPVLAHDIVVINKGKAKQYTKAKAYANTGGNTYKAWKGGDIDIGGDVGNAFAGAGASAVANEYVTEIDASSSVLVVNKGKAKQYTKAKAYADAGGNTYKAWKGGEIEIDGNVGNANAVSVAEAWANIFTTKIE